MTPTLPDPLLEPAPTAAVRACDHPGCAAGGDFRAPKSRLALRDLPIAFWDERLSTAAVTREMIAHDMTRRRRAEIVDRVAAAYILQGCLDFLGRHAD